MSGGPRKVNVMGRRPLLVFLLLGVGLAWAALLAAQPPSRPGLERGKALFLAHCAVCHGVNGHAETPVSRLLEPRPRNFTDPVEMARVSDDRIYRAIKDGRPGTAMAQWAEVLSEVEIGDLINYIRTLVRPVASGLSVEQLSIEVGRRIYQKDCAPCHGVDGRAATEAGRALNPRPGDFTDPIEMARVDDGRLYAAIKLGRPGTAMGGWGELLSPVEIIDLMRYVRSLERPLPPGVKPAGLDVLVGERIYKRHCVPCHGEKGDARTPLGRSLAPRPRDFTDAQAMGRVSDKRMTEVIAHGSPGTGMAPWGGILNPEDIRRVILYIRQTMQHVR